MICTTVLPFRKRRFTVFPPSSLASAITRLRLSGFMPRSVPVKDLPLVVVTETTFSASAATSVKYFLCATDTFYFSIKVRNCTYHYLSLIYKAAVKKWLKDRNLQVLGGGQGFFLFYDYLVTYYRSSSLHVETYNLSGSS